MDPKSTIENFLKKLLPLKTSVTENVFHQKLPLKLMASPCLAPQPDSWNKKHKISDTNV